MLTSGSAGTRGNAWEQACLILYSNLVVVHRFHLMMRKRRKNMFVVRDEPEMRSQTFYPCVDRFPGIQRKLPSKRIAPFGTPGAKARGALGGDLTTTTGKAKKDETITRG
jgi:hypothetical protein